MKILGLFICLLVCLNSTNALVCPDLGSLPCTCSAADEEVICEGSTVTQDMIDGLFLSLRESNGIGPTDWLPLASFYLQETSLTQLDLTALAYTKLSELIIFGNPQLTRLFGTSGYEDTIDVVELYMPSNALTDEGLETTLSFFVSDSLTVLYLNENNIQGSLSLVGDGTNDVEFFPGLSSFSNLQTLELRQNKISILVGGQFKRNGNLIKLYLSNNEMTELGVDALLFNEGGVDTNFRYIYLGNNKLADATINSANGLDARTLENQVSLNSNGLEFISQVNFQSFLDANDKNSLVLTGNKFVCDERMKWLKDGIDMYQFRVTGVDCTNDPGYTIFTTELV